MSFHKILSVFVHWTLSLPPTWFFFTYSGYHCEDKKMFFASAAGSKSPCEMKKDLAISYHKSFWELATRNAS
jgi:hypothetical protein